MAEWRIFALILKHLYWSSVPTRNKVENESGAAIYCLFRCQVSLGQNLFVPIRESLPNRERNDVLLEKN